MQTALTPQGSSSDILAIANIPILWILAIGIFAAIIVQSLVYMKAAKKAGPAANISETELQKSFRAGAIAAVGPSLAVVLVSIALLTLFGTPAVLVRIGLVGSAATESASASIAAGTMGAELGDASYTQAVFVVAFMAMCLSGAGWMIATLVLTPILRRGDTKLRKVNPALMAIVPAAALIGAFASLGIAELGKTPVHILAVIVSAATMGVCILLAHKTSATWLKEWGLGISIIIGLAAAYFAQTAGMAPAA